MKNLLFWFLSIFLFSLKATDINDVDFKENYIFFLNRTKIPLSELDFLWYDQSGKDFFAVSNIDKISDDEKLNNKKVVQKYFKDRDVKPRIYRFLDIVAFKIPFNAQYFKILPISKYVTSYKTPIAIGSLYTLELKPDWNYLREIAENDEALSIYYSAIPHGIIIAQSEEMQNIIPSYQVPTAQEQNIPTYPKPIVSSQKFKIHYPEPVYKSVLDSYLDVIEEEKEESDNI